MGKGLCGPTVVDAIAVMNYRAEIHTLVFLDLHAKQPLEGLPQYTIITVHCSTSIVCATATCSVRSSKWWVTPVSKHSP